MTIHEYYFYFLAITTKNQNSWHVASLSIYDRALYFTVSALAIVKIIYMIALLSISLHHGNLKWLERALRKLAIFETKTIIFSYKYISNFLHITFHFYMACLVIFISTWLISILIFFLLYYAQITNNLFSF